MHDLSIANVGYVSMIYSIGSCFWSVVLALIIRTTDRFKWLAMGMLCLELLSVRLIIKYRQPERGIGLVIMSQIFIAVGGGSPIICEEMAVMAAAPHENVSAMLRSLISSLRSAVPSGRISQALSILTNSPPRWIVSCPVTPLSTLSRTEV